MQIGEFQDFVDGWILEHGGYWPVASNLARLIEEVGELARHVNARAGLKAVPEGGENAQGEIGDLLFVLAAIARQMDVDLEQAAAAVIAKQRARGCREPAAGSQR